MSIDLNWETLTTGPDGEALAERIRDFVHTKFQAVALPRFIKSVAVHEFAFGAVAPELELKDIADPLPDFYDVDASDGDSDSDASEDAPRPRTRRASQPARAHASTHANASTNLHRVPGGTSSLNHFHHLAPAAWTGAQTPLAAMAGHLSGATAGPGSYFERQRVQAGVTDLIEPPELAPSHSRNPSHGSSISIDNYRDSLKMTPAAAAGASSPPTHLPFLRPALREKHSVSTLAPTSAGGASRPPTREGSGPSGLSGMTTADQLDLECAVDDECAVDEPPQRKKREPRVEDTQAVFRIKYAGDIRLLLTADILLDYPMPSFVGIPVRLSITGLTFDGVGVLANIRKRLHFCFLSPDDALAAVGDEQNDEESPTVPTAPTANTPKTRVGGLLQEVRVESEIGGRDGGRQSLKNVGKVERFVLEQVRRIFEEEFVYPSFWTFLV